MLGTDIAPEHREGHERSSLQEGYTRHEVAAPRAVGPSGRTYLSEGGKVELLGVMLVGEGLEVGAAAGFIDTCCADEN
jgi:hypothetical protein